MHVVFRDSQGLEDDTPQDLKQDPAELVVLSFSDSDLGAFKAGWQQAKEQGAALPTLRLANLVALKHPLSVDTYVEQTLSGAKAVLVRLIGGQQYWAYGMAQLQDLARRQGIALAVLPADGREDSQLDALSTLPVATLRRLGRLCDEGGAVAARAALAQLSLSAGLYASPVPGRKTMPQFGVYDPDQGVIEAQETSDKPLVWVSFYRSYLTSADTAPVDDLIRAFRAKGFEAYGVFAPSLKHPAATENLPDLFKAHPPALIVNATAFSARQQDGSASVLDAPGVPVFQVSLSTARRRDWLEAERGLSPADLAMHVVLPEVDGRLLAGVISFKAPEKRDPDLQYSRFVHTTDVELLEAAVQKILGHYRLATADNADKNLAIILSTYPGKSWQMAHAVGLDALASTKGILQALADDGYGVETDFASDDLLEGALSFALNDYQAALKTLPLILQEKLQEAWGDPDTDLAVRDGAFHFQALQLGKTTVALQPERGERATREDDYHDLSRVPRHGYVAFYLWLQARKTDAIVHMGAHGTLEWLPGKSVALSGECWPDALAGSTPVFYPFIVNDPGEAAQAKRRIGGVTLGHMPPPMAQSETPHNLIRLEQLLDEYSTAEGLDPARRTRLIDTIVDEAHSSGVASDLGLAADASAAEAMTRIDRFVCDIKESQYGDGLHVYGSGDHGVEEITGLIKGLAGQRIDAGPSGSPDRGRQDIRPTGRNLFTTDPRSVPTRAGHAQGVKMAEELVRRHLQEEGDYPRGLVVDLWGSATMRTAGEEFAMALHLAGITPQWDDGSERVSGFVIEPLAMLGRPRIDVTLRVSGLFRDIFPGLAGMFEQAVKALAARDEADDFNPYLAAEGETTPRVFGPKPGSYGLEMGQYLEDYSDEARQMAGEAWLKASEWAIGQDGSVTQNRAALEAQLNNVDAFVHVQDLAETDVLLAPDYVGHEAGVYAALKSLGKEAPALYHLDSTRMDDPRARTLTEEIARVVRARAANPAWADGMMRHGFRGGAEIAATLDQMAAFQHLSDTVPGHLFDQYFDATLGREEVLQFLEEENPEALQAMKDRFNALLEAGLWKSRRNSIYADLEALS